MCDNSMLIRLKDSCRICLTKEADMKIISACSDSSSTSYKDMISALIYAAITESDRYPERICSGCADTVSKAYHLKMKCQETDAYLIALINNTSALKNVDRGDEEAVCDGESFENDLSGTTVSNSEKHTGHQSRKRDKSYHCQVNNCKWSFGTEYELTIHSMVNHQESDANQCMICNKTFKNKRCLRQHMFVHRTVKRFKCRYCDKGFNFAKHLENHEVVHTKMRKYLCQMCGRAFTLKDRLILHMQRHNGERSFTCSQCMQKFFTKSELRIHLKKHLGKNNFVCATCGVTLASKASLVRHMRNKHISDSVTNPLSACAICGTVCHNRDQIQQHMKMHLQQYYCLICKKGFASAISLEVHTKTHDHNNVRNHQCIKCGLNFSRAFNLKIHQRRRHAFPTTKNVHSCKDCNKTFTTAVRLLLHNRLHSTEVTEFTCRICDLRCESASKLRQHKRSQHYSKSLYGCDVCRKSYTRSKTLEMHMAKMHMIAIVDS